MVDSIKNAVPDAVIYLQSILPVNHENADIIINRWYEIFKPEDDEDQ